MINYMLAQPLPGAVADACRAPSQQAVKKTVVETLCSPDLRSMITGAATRPGGTADGCSPRPDSEPRSSRRLRLRRTAVSAGDGEVRVATPTVRAFVAVMPFPKVVLAGTDVGLVVASIASRRRL